MSARPPRTAARRTAGLGRLLSPTALLALVIPAVTQCRNQTTVFIPEATTTVPPETAAFLVGAGDIGDCNSEFDEATGRLLDGLLGTIFTAGDNAYFNGTERDFAECYESAWGRHKDRTRPATGNHEYLTAGAAPYFAYFGASAGDAGRGYYSYDLGAWHILVLNSSISYAANSPQMNWLLADLQAHPVNCSLAYWHHPLFSSGNYATPTVRPLWHVLGRFGLDVVINGHDHLYERFLPQTPDGVPDPAGIRQFTVGTGGGEFLHAINARAANSEIINNTEYGVLHLTLYSNRYYWRFMPIAGATFADSGVALCH
jgi:acid phosphatase type 7